MGRIKLGITRWLVLLSTLSSFNCEPECEQPDGEVPLVSVEQDPTLGIFEGPIDWLQSGDQSTLRVTVARATESGTRVCDRTQVELTYSLEGDEPGISASPARSSVRVDDTGVIVPTSESVSIDAVALVDAGKLPDAPGIADRQPIAALILEPTPENELSATIEVRSSKDQLTVALGTLKRAQ